MSQRTRILVIDDLLDEPLAVNGCLFDCNVRAVVRDSQGFDIDSVEIGDVYLVFGTQSFFLDQDEFKIKQNPLWTRLKNAIDKKILEFARDAQDEDWKIEEYAI
jgi:hypothetical protein